MVINNTQVIFWENLQDNGQVVKAIAQYNTQNKTQNCTQQSQNSTQQAPSTNSPSNTTTPTNGNSTTTRP